MNSKFYFILGILILYVSFNIGCVKNNGYTSISNQRETEYLLSVLGLQMPIKIADVGYYEDGGTIGVLIIDIKDDTLAFCKDGRMRLIDPNKPLPDYEPRFFYLGATHPTSQKARKIPIGGIEERALFKVLKLWVDEIIPDEKEIERLLNTKSPGTTLSQRELDIRHLLMLMVTLENRVK